MSKAKLSKWNPHIGGTFEDFLREEGIYEAVQTTAMKRVLAMQLAEAMKKSEARETNTMKNEYDFSAGKRGSAVRTQGKIRIEIHVDCQTITALKSQSDRTGRSMQTLINDAIARYVETPRRKRVSRGGAKAIMELIAKTQAVSGFRPFPARGGVVTNEWIDNLREEIETTRNSASSEVGPSAAYPAYQIGATEIRLPRVFTHLRVLSVSYRRSCARGATHFGLGYAQYANWRGKQLLTSPRSVGFLSAD